MSKKWKQLAEHLEANGKRAPATVVEVSSSGTDVSSDGFSPMSLIGLSDETDNRYHLRKATLRVKPKGEDEFEVERQMRFAQYMIPDPGEEIEVLYDPADHEQVMVAPPKQHEYDPSKGLGETKVGFTLDLSRFRRKKK